MKNSSFKEEIYVTIEGEGKDSYLVACDNVDDLEEGSIAVYKLVKVGKKITKHSLEFK